MQSVNFVLPTVDTAGMSRDDQGALIVNQATAVIVAAYLEHATAMYQADQAQNINFRVWPQPQTIFPAATDIGTLIDTVQNALRAF